MKRIVICADGTWNRPERLGEDDFPTNVLKLARAVKPIADDKVHQIVFYDWGLGSYHDAVVAGSTGKGINKNILDAYRFLVHNYQVGDAIYLFGFSRGAYTVRSLAAMINNCGILKSNQAKHIELAFSLYKNPTIKPDSKEARKWRADYALESTTPISMIGAWDTVGALGLPFTFFGMLEESDLFYDYKVGNHVSVVRHALALDEFRSDFAPCIWSPHSRCDIQQMWFLGAHSDVGGGYAPDPSGECLSAIPYHWMLEQAQAQGLDCLVSPDYTWQKDYMASVHNEYKGKYKLLGKLTREIPNDNKTCHHIHPSVLARVEAGYKSPSIDAFNTSS